MYETYETAAETLLCHVCNELISAIRREREDTLHSLPDAELYTPEYLDGRYRALMDAEYLITHVFNKELEKLE